jgi:Fe-S cluster assembly protein SufD
VTLKLGHNQPNTNSDETFRNVLYDNAKGVFQGQIKVAQIAQKTDAQMACNTLLLSDDADFSAKPELEIFADDVICAHGATVTDIDPAQLFYLMARGVTEKTARGLLVKGFVAEVVEEFDDEAVVEALEGIITDWLNKNG